MKQRPSTIKLIEVPTADSNVTELRVIKTFYYPDGSPEPAKEEMTFTSTELQLMFGKLWDLHTKVTIDSIPDGQFRAPRRNMYTL